jgi:hypothetical protein
MPSEQGARITTRTSIYVLMTALVALAGTWWAVFPAADDEPSGAVRVKAEAPTVAAASATHSPMAARPATPPFSASPEILAALSLPAGSVFRGVTTLDVDDGVTCGEVSSSQGDRSFRRFVYIASARSGFVDDGGPVFRQISATSCTQR